MVHCRDTRGDAFAMTVNRQVTTKRPEPGPGRGPARTPSDHTCGRGAALIADEGYARLVPSDQRRGPSP
jgi:hypothetical protein